MQTSDHGRVSMRLRRIATETAELPGIRLLAKPAYRSLFQRPYRGGNAYFGCYRSHAEALAAAPRALPATYDLDSVGQMYRDRHESIRVSDYPAVYWLSRLIQGGSRRIFDLGGHVGISYYGFSRYLDYPVDLAWQVHDLPAVLASGRQWAAEHDPRRQLSFADSPEAVDDHDILFTSGALQYLDYSLPELLGRVQRPPRHVLVNLTPMHPHKGYFTLQNIGKAVLPYRVGALPEFINDMAALGYTVRDQWHSTERHLRIPFEPQCTLDAYSGIMLQKSP